MARGRPCLMQEAPYKPKPFANPAASISSLDLQKLYKKLLSGGRVERVESKNQPKELSAKTVRNINQMISSAMGLRRGELLGLKWEDIDLEQGIIHVRRQIARIDGEIVEAPLKQRNTNSEYVFPSPTGGAISPDSVLKMLHRVLKRKERFQSLRY